MRADSIGLYVHIPFCVRKCSYCDFCSFSKNDFAKREEYIEKLCDEIDGYSDRKIKLDSIFFGGGTPSYLTPTEFSKIAEHIKKAFTISPDTEFTIEANPCTLDNEKLMAYTRAGVNRISIGLQTIHENELKILGRIHNYKDFLDSYNLVRSHGFDNVNIDLMFGIPEQTIDSFEKTLRAVIELSPEHVSVYGLILEEGTPLHENRDSFVFPAEDDEGDMYYLAAKILRRAGYSHYEISNYAKHGRECRHNLKYWRDEEYIGVGLSAYSYFDGRRFGNTCSPDGYLQDLQRNEDSVENIDKDAEAYEYVMLRLRLAEGFDLEDYKARFGKDFVSSREKIIKKLSDAGYLKVEGTRLSLSESGFYVSNSILTELI